MNRLAHVLIPLVFTLAACSGGADAVKTDEYTEAMAKEHAKDTSDASEAVQEAAKSQVVSETVTYATVNGTPISGHLTRPVAAEGTLPAVIVIHEWWGLNDNVRNMADQLAAEGYLVLAVDLYAGKSADAPEDAMALMKGAMADTAPLQDNLKQAHAFLEATGSTKVGVMGWCFGGAWSLQAGLIMPDSVDAMVIYYGKLVTEEEKLKPLQMPILGHFAELDQGISLDSVKAFEASLKNLGKNAEIHVYEGADHAFANPSGQRYKKDAAQTAWERTKAFLASNLKG